MVDFVAVPVNITELSRCIMMYTLAGTLTVIVNYIFISQLGKSHDDHVRLVHHSMDSCRTASGATTLRAKTAGGSEPSDGFCGWDVVLDHLVMIPTEF